MLTIPNADIIEKHLKLAVGQDALPLITPDEARTRAVAIEQEMKLVGFGWYLTDFAQSRRSILPEAEKIIGDEFISQKACTIQEGRYPATVERGKEETCVGLVGATSATKKGTRRTARRAPSEEKATAR